MIREGPKEEARGEDDEEDEDGGGGGGTVYSVCQVGTGHCTVQCDAGSLLCIGEATEAGDGRIYAADINEEMQVRGDDRRGEDINGEITTAPRGSRGRDKRTRWWAGRVGMEVLVLVVVVVVEDVVSGGGVKATRGAFRRWPRGMWVCEDVHQRGGEVGWLQLTECDRREVDSGCPDGGGNNGKLNSTPTWLASP